MKQLTLIITALIFSLPLSAQVYLDGDAGDGGDGSEGNPFNEVSDISSWSANTTYYFKRGTHFYLTSKITLTNDSTVLDAYGAGDRPRIWTDLNIGMLDSNDPNGKPVGLEVKNLFFEQLQPPKCFNETPNVIDMKACISPRLENVKTRGGGRGINGSRVEGNFEIINCEVTNTDDDGTWLYHCETVTFDNHRTDSINRGRQFDCESLGKTQTGGDCIQYVNQDLGDKDYRLVIKNSVLNRGPWKHKFNIMVGSYSGNQAVWPTLEVYNTTFIHEGRESEGNDASSEGSHIYTNEVDSVIIDKCIFKGGNQNAFYKGYFFDTKYIVTRSIFYNQSNYIFWLQNQTGNHSIKLYNNTLIGMPGMNAGMITFGANVEMKNNVFVDFDKLWYSTDNMNNAVSNNNLYYNINSNYDQNETGAVYSDPQFVNSGNRNYRVQLGSPAIDAGVEAIINIRDMNNEIDIDSTTVPQGSGWDIGAFEFDEGGSTIEHCDTVNIDLSVQVTNTTGSDGAINLSVNGGTAPYSYEWSNDSTTQDIASLSPGTYHVTVTDDSTCTATGNWTVQDNCDIDPLQLSANVTNETDGDGSGAIDLSVSGGNTPYSYLWSNSATTQDLTGLSAGEYSVIVTDDITCEAKDTFTVNNVVPGEKVVLSYPNFSDMSEAVLNGEAQVLNDTLKLVDNLLWDVGSFYDTNKVGVDEFNAEFTFDIGGDRDVDGFTFIMQNSSLTALGTPGNGLGYQQIDNSFCVGFDYYNGNRIGVYKNGETPDGGDTFNPTPIDLNSGNDIKVWVTYDGQIRVSLKDLVTNDSVFHNFGSINIVNEIGADDGWFGMTGATGGKASTINIHSFFVNEEGVQTPSYIIETNITGSGSIELSPTGGTYDSSTVVQVTATPDAGWSFDSWSGDLSGSTNPDNITMDSNKSVTATFTEDIPAPEIQAIRKVFKGRTIKVNETEKSIIIIIE